MSDEPPSSVPTQVVTELYRLFAQGRLDETFDLMSEDVVLREPGDPELLPWAGVFRGHDGLRRFYDGLGAGLSRIEIDADSLELTPLDERRVLAVGTERGTAAATGRVYQTRSAWIWTVEAGRITGLVAFHDTAAMAEAMR